MFDIHSVARWRARVTLGLAGALLLVAAGCVKAPPAQPDAKLSITATQPAGTYQPGDDVRFKVTVTNAGSKDISYVTIGAYLGAYMRERSISCSPLGPSATQSGDEPCSNYLYLQRLAKGTSVTLDIVATIDGDAPGSVVNNFSASVLQGPDPVSTTNQATVVDTRSGSYKAFTSDGRQFDLAADFSTQSFTFGGNGENTMVPAAYVPGTPSYFFGSKGSFMAHHDLLAGDVPLDGKTPVFLAARKFVQTAAELDGRTFNAFGIATSGAGTPTSAFQTLAFGGSSLQVCADAVPHAIASCPPVALSTWALTVADGVFTGVDATHGDTITFQVAQSDSALVFLRAEPAAAGRVFQVGLSTNSGIADNLLWGADTAGSFNGKMEFTSGFAEETFGSETRTGPLSTIVGGPAGLASSLIVASTNLPVWLAEDSGLAIVMGQPGGSQDGLLQVFAY